jgi:predicted RNA-binding Zn-ribbon protein involved in translation (DUF1610 family)
MKLGFEESQLHYTSGSQSARAWTEAWVKAWAYCPHCGTAKMSQFPNNSPVADFLCTNCAEEFELKSQKGKRRTKKYSSLPNFGIVVCIVHSGPRKRGVSRSSRHAGRTAVDMGHIGARASQGGRP